MYDNSAPSAESQYGIGKGLAQVIDLTPLRENAANEAKFNYAKRQADQAKKDKRASDIYSALGDLDSAAIYSGHRPEFAQAQKDLSSFVYENIDKLRSGDTDTTMQFQNMYSQIKTNAELSKNFRETKERLGLEIAKDPTKYRPESIDYYTQSGRNPDGSLSYELDPSQLKTNTDLITDFKTNIRPIIEDMAKGKSYSYTDAQGNETSVDINNFDRKSARALLLEQVKRPEVAEQAAYEFNKLSPDEQNQYGDFNEYYVEKMMPMALVDQNKTVVKKGEDKKYTFKDGAWTNDTYAWTYNKGKIADRAEPAPGFEQGDEYEEISLSNRKTETDNKPIALTQANGETHYGIPKGIIKKKGWDQWRVAVEQVDKKTGRPVVGKNGKVKVAYVPLKNNTAKIQGEYGFNAEEAIKEVSGSQPSTVKKGQVVNGYTFLGGDPKDQKNWKKN